MPKDPTTPVSRSLPTSPISGRERRRSLVEKLPARLPALSRSKSFPMPSLLRPSDKITMPSNNLKAKSACNWTHSDLVALDVHMISVGVHEFFRCVTDDDLPEPSFIYPFFKEILTAGYVLRIPWSMNF